MVKSDIDYLFTAGFIAPWYLRRSQIPFYNLLKTKKRVVAKCHRRFGKGTTLFVYTFERCQREKVIVRYGAPTQKEAHEILTFLMDKVYEWCPTSKPKWNSRDTCWQYPSGSQIFIFGAKDREELDKARGKEADIIICDEFAFWKHRPRYYLDSVLGPQVDTTNGQIIIPSTPPEDLTHPYVEEVARAEVTGSLFSWDITKSLAVGDVGEAQHKRIIERCGGTHTDAYKREYLCEMIASKSRLVVPEAQDDSLYVGEFPRPPYFDGQAMFDLGFVDFFAGLFGYLDFVNARLCVESELWLNYASTGEITKACLEAESRLGWTPKRRQGDCSDPQQLYDMSHDHGYSVSPITKRSKQSTQGFRDSVINQLRIAIPQRKIIVNPKGCPRLIQQLKYGIWNERRTDFERTETMGHLDLLIALAYLYDNVDWAKNPYPLLPQEVQPQTHFIHPEIIAAKSPAKSWGKLVGK